ncbi:MAG: protein kinase [Fibrobacteria bacterium]|nr:protein kinase [Fibrobacteria bacterium]
MSLSQNGKNESQEELARKYQAALREIAQLRKKVTELSKEGEETEADISKSEKIFEGVRKFGKYELLEMLGKGGMGEVWRGRDDFGNEVALKMLPTDKQSSKSQVEHLMREATVMSQLHHRGICRIHEVGEAEGVNYIALEHVLGASLSGILEYGQKKPRGSRKDQPETNPENLSIFEKACEDVIDKENSKLESRKNAYIKPGQRLYNILEEKKAAQIVLNICTAIQFAHDNGVFHRDIKPQNIILRPDGEPVVMDFGVAKTHLDKSESLRPGQGKVYGTLEYMAPEQARASEKSNALTDIYSIGAVLYQMVTGRKHFNSSKNILQDIRQLQRHEPVNPKFYNKKLSIDCEAIILKALSNATKHRYQSAQEFADDLKRLLEDEPVQAKPFNIPYRVKKRLAKNKLASTLGLLILAGLLSFGGYLYYEWQKQWGNWILEYKANFTATTSLPKAFMFTDQGNRKIKKEQLPLNFSTRGLALPPSFWCWFRGNRNLKLDGDIRIVVDMEYASEPDLFQLCMNTSKAKPFTGQPPGSYFLRYGTANGTMDQLSRRNYDGSITGYRVAENSIEPASHHQLILQRIEGNYRYYRNNKEILNLQQVMPLDAQNDNHIGFITTADSVYVKSFSVFRLSRAQKSSPLIAGEALKVRGQLKEAVDEFLTIAEDNVKSEVAERAIIKAFSIAIQHKQLFGDKAKTIKRYFYKNYPNSLYSVKILELETLILWKKNKLPQAMANLKRIYRDNPDSDVLFQLEFRNIPDSLLSGLTEIITRANHINGLVLPLVQGELPRSLAGSAISMLDLSDHNAQGMNILTNSELTWLFADGAGITSLSPLKNSPLRFLHAANNRIESLSPIAGKKLESLNLSVNMLNDLAALKDMPIRRLNIAGNAITDISPLVNMPLISLDISGNGIEDLSALQEMPLHDLQMAQNHIKSLAPLKSLPLRKINFQHNLISDVSTLRYMPLTHIYAGNNMFSNLEPLRGMKLIHFELQNNRITNYKPLNTISIQSLDIRHNNLKAVEKLYSPELEVLFIDHNQIKSFNTLKHLKLKKLYCSHNQITNLSLLKPMKLELLNVQDNKLTTLAPFYNNPPDTFLFASHSLSDFVIKKAIKYWSANSEYQYNTHYAKVVYYMRHNYVSRLKDMSKIYNGHYYLHITRQTSWEDAQKLCHRLGGHLVTINNSEENEFLSTVMQDNHPSWTGLVSREGQWTWENGEQADYVNSPSICNPEICHTLLFARHGLEDLWQHSYGTAEAGFIIEWEE